MHSVGSVPDFDTAHNRNTLNHQRLRRLSALSSFEAVSAHEGRDSHRNRPCLRHSDDPAPHEGVYGDDGLVAFDLCIPQIHIKPAHESHQVPTAEILGANPVFAAAQHGKYIQVW